MEVSWVLSADYADPIVKSETIKNIGSTWGSWKTWRSWNTEMFFVQTIQKHKIS